MTTDAHAREAGRTAIRSAMRTRRASLDTAALDIAGDALAAQLALELTAAHTVSGYLAFGGEIPLGQVLAQARTDNRRTCVPVVTRDGLVFMPIDDDTPLVMNRFGIAEPDIAANPGSVIDPLTLDLVLVPLVAFDLRGNRIGMGGGFYDRCFAALATRDPASAHCAHRPRLVGVAHAFQQVDDALPMPWDVPLDAIVTDAGYHPITPRGAA